MTTPDIAPDASPSPSRLERWKAMHGVRTHLSPSMGESSQWLAVAFSTALIELSGYNLTDDEKSGIMALYGGYCRLINEAGWDATGSTEDFACWELCQKMKWPWLSSLDIGPFNHEFENARLSFQKVSETVHETGMDFDTVKDIALDLAARREDLMGELEKARQEVRRLGVALSQERQITTYISTADKSILDRLDAVTAAELLGRPGLTGREILERNVAAREAERAVNLSSKRPGFAIDGGRGN